MLRSSLKVDPFFWGKAISTIILLVIFGSFGLAQAQLSSENQLKQDHLSMEYVEKWIGSPVGTQRSPWFICVRMQGTSLMYKAKVYAIQARYQSWTAEWHRFRPQPYPSDDGVGLVTTQELAQLYINIHHLAKQAKSPYKLYKQAPPCGAELYENAVQTRSSTKAKNKSTPTKRSRKTPVKRSKNGQDVQAELKVDLWLLNQVNTEDAETESTETKKTGQSWQHWEFIDPHLSIEQYQQLMIQEALDLITKVAPEEVDSDRLIESKDSGILLLTVTEPSKVWLNGVYHGLWPSSRPIYLASDDYRVHVVPLDQNLSPITFEGLEITAGVKTKFRVEVE